MALLSPENFESVTPTEADTLLARESIRLLAARGLGRRAASASSYSTTGRGGRRLPYLPPRCDCSCTCSPRCRKETRSR
jgi:hypothetical protein